MRQAQDKQPVKDDVDHFGAQIANHDRKFFNPKRKCPSRDFRSYLKAYDMQLCYRDKQLKSVILLKSFDILLSQKQEHHL